MQSQVTSDEPSSPIPGVVSNVGSCAVLDDGKNAQGVGVGSDDT